MLKTIALVVACSAAAFGASSAARTVYSPLQPATPVGSSFKMSPDIANIWSWHETISTFQFSTSLTPVLVDFDGNGVMDTEYPFARVVITDMQVQYNARKFEG